MGSSSLLLLAWSFSPQASGHPASSRSWPWVSVFTCSSRFWGGVLHCWTSMTAQQLKNPPANVGNASLIPGLGRSLSKKKGSPLQYSSLKNPMDRGAWWATLHGVAKSQIRLSDYWVRSLDREDPVKKEMATHSSVLLWRILWTEEPGELQSMQKEDEQKWYVIDICRLHTWFCMIFSFRRLGGSI